MDRENGAPASSARREDHNARFRIARRLRQNAGTRPSRGLPMSRLLERPQHCFDRNRGQENDEHHQKDFAAKVLHLEPPGQTLTKDDTTLTLKRSGCIVAATSGTLRSSGY